MNIKIDFAEEKTYKSLMRMFLPVLAVILLNMICNAVDLLCVVKMIGEDFCTRVFSTGGLYIILLIGIASGAANGISIIVSNFIGRKDDKKTQTAISTTFRMAVIFAVLSFILLELFQPAVMKWLYALPDEGEKIMREYMIKYMSIYLIGSIPVCLYFYFSAILKSFGNTIIQLVSMIICTVINAVLAPIFVKMMGLNGAAAATVLSQIIGLIFMIIYIRQNKLFSINLKDFDKTIAVKTIKSAIPLIFQPLILIMSITIIALMYSQIGSSSLQVYNAIRGMQKLLFYPAIAFSVVLINIASQCVGAGRVDKLRDYIKASIIIGIPILAVLSVIMVIYCGKPDGLYLNNSETAAMVRKYFMMVGAGYILNVVTAIFIGAANGLGRPGKGVIIFLLNYIVFRVILAFLLRGSLGINGIWIATLASYVTACISAVLYVKVNLKEK